MATGIEVVGLVLGAIPLIISALEHYEDFVTPAKAFVLWKGHLRKLIQELYMVRASYDQATRLLLRSFADLADQTTMIDDPRSKLWTEGDVADNLRDGLGPMYDPFIFTIHEISDILVEIAACLNVPGSQQIATSQNLLPIVSSNSPVASTPFVRKNYAFVMRIKFTMKKNRVKTALQRLESCTTRIDTWTTRADKLQDEPMHSRLKLRFCTSVNTIQGNADKIYRAVSTNWCGARSDHIAYLMLEQRLVRTGRKRRPPMLAASTSLSRPTRFGLSFQGNCCALSQRLNSEIRIDENSFSTKTATVTISVSTVDDEDKIDPASLQRVENLCKLIKQPPNPLVRFSLDDAGELRSYPSSKAAGDFVDQLLTLEALLPYFEARLPIAEMYSLTITLVASVFQLSHTPWLESEWNKKNISFLRANNSPPLSVDLRYPYLTKEFSHANLPQQQLSGIASGRDASNLLSLAVVLLEITSGQSTEQRRVGNQVNNIQINNQSDLHLAETWLKEEKLRGRLSCAFYQAILTCLQEYLNPDADFSDPQYCDMLKGKLLLPLEEEMEFLLNGPPTS